MANFFEDNDDLRFYVEKWIDWEPLFEDSTLLGETDGPADCQEAVELWTDILTLVGEFSAEEIAPYAEELDREGVLFDNGEVSFPERAAGIFEQLKEMELHGLCVPGALGGMSAPMMIYFLSIEVMGRADVSVMAHHGFHGGMAMAMLMYSALEGSTKVDVENKKLIETRWEGPIREIVAGEAWGSMDLTEPDAGSDLAKLRTTATQDDDGNWFVTGQKIFITSGHGRYHFCLARTGTPDSGLDGLSLFLVPAWDDEGNKYVTVSRVEEKLGHHASPTVTVDYENAPAELVGKLGEGFKMMLLIMNNARISVGFEALGLMECAYRMAWEYTHVRESMGKPIAKHEILADWLDEMKTDIQGLRALAVAAGYREERVQRARLKLQFLGEGSKEAIDRQTWKSRKVTPLIKYLAAEKAVEIARRTVQMHGGSGYTTEYGAEKLLRDAMVLPIYEGTSQIQALMATKDNLGWALKNPTRFARQIADARLKANVSRDPHERRVARIRSMALSAQRHLITKIAKDKLMAGGSFREWDQRKDFAPALLHAERLTRILTDAAICDELLKQARKHPERVEVLERYLERAEPRCRDELYRIQHTGDRILRELSDEPEAVAEAAK